MTRSIFTFIITAALSITFLTQCGPSEEERRAMEQARQDSIAQAEADSIAEAKAEAERERQAELERQRKLEEQRERERRRIVYAADGNFTIQAQAWRSLDKAKVQLEKWKNRGAEYAFIVKHGDEETGNVWFRVRLGRYANLEMAEKHAALVKTDYNAKTWVTSVKPNDEIVVPAKAIDNDNDGSAKEEVVE